MTFRQTSNSKPRTNRAAFTLLEMLLVLSLLLVLVSVVWPAVLRISSSNQLRQGMQDLHSAMQAARIRAIENGVNYQVYLELGGQHFLVVPVDQSLIGASSGQPVIEGSLPEGFEFSKTVSSAVSQPAIPFEWLANLPNAKDMKWMEGSFPITFFPDGSAALDLNHSVLKNNRPVARVELRSLTGSTSISYNQEKS